MNRPTRRFQLVGRFNNGDQSKPRAVLFWNRHENLGTQPIMNYRVALIWSLLSLMVLGCGPGVEPQGELSTQQEKNIPPDDWSNGPWKNQYPTAECVAVIDGDTVDLLIDSNKTIRVRLASIDAPEPGQPFGSAAQKMLSELISGKKVRYDMARPDKDGRGLAFLYVGIDGKPTDVNLQLVAAGLAWP
ncbi:MAG: thermonuclease family protein, partial [Pirellulaceae bacterium]|nr:thermonuclease family protein [Pirellulaceae bacterium]